MESSSNDSFLWSDASNNSVNMSSGSNTAQSQGDSLSKTKKEQNNCSTFLDNNNKITNKNHRDPKKRKQPESSDESQPKKKRIKEEPESDKDNRKQKKLKNIGKVVNKTNYESHSSVLNDEACLSLLVKKEQESCITPEIVKVKKSKKCKKPRDNNSFNTQSISDPDKNGDIDVDIEVKPELQTGDSEMEDYLNVRVKQEQASVQASTNVITKSKKKKKRKRSESSSDENTISSKYMQLNDTAIENNSSPCGEQSYVNCSVIDEKFSAGKSEIEKRKNKKHKNDAHSIFSNRSQNNIKVVSMEDSADNTYNDKSFRPHDFTCSNVVSSTVMNNSMEDTLNDTKNHMKDGICTDLLKKDNDLQQVTSISDRIRLEDDDTQAPQHLAPRRVSSKLKTFLRANPQIEIVPKTQNNCLVSEDDDIWIIRCPHDMNLKELKNNSLSLEGKCKIKMNGQTYNGVRNDDLARVTVVTYQNGQASLRNLPVKGCLNYRKRIPKTHIPDNISMPNDQTSIIPLPETKCRHPLFGSDYKKSLKIPAAVTARLQAAKERHEVSCEIITKKRSKKHKKKIIDIKNEEDAESEIEIFKKKKNRKPSQDVPSASKKKKTVMHERDNTKAWESDKAIEENLFNF